MKITIDLEGTLIPECGEFRCEPTGGLAGLLWRRSLRRGAGALLRDLQRAGHSLSLSVSLPLSPQSVRKLKLWFRLQGIRVRGVAPATSSCPGCELLLSSSPRYIEVARRSGVRGLLLTSAEPDWTLRVWQATLQGQGFEVLTVPTSAQLV